MALRLLASRVSTSGGRATYSFSNVRFFAKKAGKGKNKKPPTHPAPPESVDEFDFKADADDELEAQFQAQLAQTRRNMQGGVQNLNRALSQMRPGKADAGIFDDLRIPAYGEHVPLPQVAQVAVQSSHALSITPYDPSLASDVKDAVAGVNPVYQIREDGQALHITFPKMSMETRKDLLKAVRKHGEQARQHVRRARQDSMNEARAMKKEVSEDDIKRVVDQIQVLTDEAIGDINNLLEAKEQDLTVV